MAQPHESAIALLQQMRPGEPIVLRWHGSRVPTGAVVRGHTICHTQHGVVYGTGWEMIGTYERVVDGGGADGQEQQMRVWIWEDE